METTNRSILLFALRRGAVHFVIGLFIAFGSWLLPRFIIITILVVVLAIMIVLEMARLYLPGIRAIWLVAAPVFSKFMRTKESTGILGATCLIAGSLLTIVLLPASIAFLAIVFLAASDPAAAIFGIWKGRTRFKDGKTLEGHLAGLIVCLIAAVSTTLLMNIPLTTTLTGAVIAALFQALPLKVDDNLTIPIGSGLVMWAIQGMTVG